MIAGDVAWEDLEEHLIAGAARTWAAMIKSVPADRQAEFVARLEAGELALGGEWSSKIDEQGNPNGLAISPDELALPTYAFGSEGPGEPIAVFLVVHPIDEGDVHAYIGIGWLEDAWAPVKPALRLVGDNEGGEP